MCQWSYENIHPMVIQTIRHRPIFIETAAGINVYYYFFINFLLKTGAKAKQPMKHHSHTLPDF
jgi:hypothetical protein